MICDLMPPSFRFSDVQEKDLADGSAFRDNSGRLVYRDPGKHKAVQSYELASQLHPMSGRFNNSPDSRRCETASIVVNHTSSDTGLRQPGLCEYKRKFRFNKPTFSEIEASSTAVRCKLSVWRIHRLSD